MSVSRADAARFMAFVKSNAEKEREKKRQLDAQEKKKFEKDSRDNREAAIQAARAKTGTSRLTSSPISSLGGIVRANALVVKRCESATAVSPRQSTTTTFQTLGSTPAAPATDAVSPGRRLTMTVPSASGSLFSHATNQAVQNSYRRMIEESPEGLFAQLRVPLLANAF